MHQLKLCIIYTHKCRERKTVEALLVARFVDAFIIVFSIFGNDYSLKPCIFLLLHFPCTLHMPCATPEQIVTNLRTLPPNSLHYQFYLCPQTWMKWEEAGVIYSTLKKLYSEILPYSNIFSDCEKTPKKKS